MRRNTPERSGRRWVDERAVSEVVGFILVFAVIFGSVGVLYMSGFQAMEDYQGNEQQVNAERAMEALADNFNDVLRYDSVEQRQGEMSLRDGQIRVGENGTKLDISVDIGDGNGEQSINTTDPGAFEDFYGDGTLGLGEFTYTSDSRIVAYEGGGLVRSGESEDWSTVAKRPHLTCNDNTAVISLAQVTSHAQSRQSASGIELTMTEQTRSSVVYDGVEYVSVAVDEDDTPYFDAWESILENGGWEDGTCDFDDDDGTVVVTIVEVDIEF